MTSIEHNSPKNKPDLSKINLLQLIGANTDLKHAATTNGGEFAGPCPFCGGEDRFRVWPTPTEGNPRYWCRKCERQGDAIDYVRERDQLDFPGALAKLGLGNAAPADRNKAKLGKLIAEYIYKDATGQPVCRVTRHEPKDFRQWRWDDGKWKAGLKGQIPPLYNLPDVIKAIADKEVVWLVEGEKSAAALTDRAVIATCNAMGAGKWHATYSQSLENARVAIIPDNDDAGIKHARNVAKELVGIASEVRIVNLPGLAYSETHGEDIVDWLGRGGTLRDLFLLYEDSFVFKSNRRRVELNLAELLQTDFPPPNWAVPDLLPEGLNYLAGAPKIKKSWMALQLGAAISTGGQFLDKQVQQGRVLYIALEDIPRRMKERSEAQRIPPNENLIFRFEWPTLDNGGVEALQERLNQQEYRLVIIDTLARFSGEMDHSSNTEVSVRLGELQQLALNMNIAILLLDHHRKGNGLDRNVIDDLLGARGKGAVADGVWGIYRNPGARDVNLMMVGRDIEEQDLLIQWDDLTYCWQLVGDANEVANTTMQDDILSALEDMGAASNIEVADAIAKDRSNVWRSLNDLIHAGKVKRVLDGKSYTYTLCKGSEQ